MNLYTICTTFIFQNRFYTLGHDAFRTCHTQFKIGRIQFSLDYTIFMVQNKFGLIENEFTSFIFISRLLILWSSPSICSFILYLIHWDYGRFVCLARYALHIAFVYCIYETLGHNIFRAGDIYSTYSKYIQVKV